MKKESALLSCLSLWLCLSTALLGSGVGRAQETPRTATPAPLVEAYGSLADVILASKKTEWNLVHSILAMTYQHADATLQRALAQIRDGKSAEADVEALADLVSQLGNEGDASVAAVRKKLLEGGHHHHHASAEQEGDYDPGFVIVTRSAKKTFLEAASAIGRLSGSKDASALEAQWERVRQVFQRLDDDSKRD